MPPTNYGSTFVISTYGSITWNDGTGNWRSADGAEPFIQASIGDFDPRVGDPTNPILLIEIDYASGLSLYFYYDPNSGDFILKQFQSADPVTVSTDNLLGPSWVSGETDSAGDPDLDSVHRTDAARGTSAHHHH